MNAAKIVNGIRNPRKAMRHIVTELTSDGDSSLTSESAIGGSCRASVCRHLRADTKLLEQALNGTKIDRSLEVGCGYGRLTPWFVDHANDHYGVDPEHRLVTDARDFNEVADFCRGDANHLPFVDSSFNLVVIWGVLRYFGDDEVTEIAAETKRVMCDDGLLLMTEITDGVKKTDHLHQRSLSQWESLFDMELQRHVERGTFGRDYSTRTEHLMIFK